jgi:NAD(P)-dependent dehydrogenase (short-subunit alcohol dehydrogenase family)
MSRLNHLSNRSQSRLLLPLMETTASSFPTSEPVRIIELSSDAHNVNPWTGSGVINYELVRDSTMRRSASGRDLYAHSKSGNVLVAKARARLLTGKNILSVSVHPGESELQMIELGSSIAGHIDSELIRHRNYVEKYIVRLQRISFWVDSDDILCR